MFRRAHERNEGNGRRTVANRWPRLHGAANDELRRTTAWQELLFDRSKVDYFKALSNLNR
jgi:hypothetical protein